MRFGYTIVYVRDVADSVEFYERAFGLERRLLHESGQYAELETGSTALAFGATVSLAHVPQVTENRHRRRAKRPRPAGIESFGEWQDRTLG